MKTWDDFKESWVVDYEFVSNNGNPQIPICYVAQNVNSGEIISQWLSESEKLPKYPINNSSLFIAYYASAELGCHRSLDFKDPPYVVDLFAEFRCLTNGIKVPSGNSLIGACNFYGLSSSDATYKDAMRDRILQGFPFSNKEKQEILDYCKKDVKMTTQLFRRMQPNIDLPYALLRGRYMASVASMEYYGVPIDMQSLEELRDCWNIIKEELIWKVDKDYNVYEGTTFKIAKFKKYLEKYQIPWDYTPEGLPKTDNDYMKQQAKVHARLKPLQELRYSLGQMKLKNLQVGEDGHNRCLLSPFCSKTSRNQPSSSKFIFGNAVWLRNLIKPEEGRAISYIDYEQQEIGIAAALSQDNNLMIAYGSGDPYVAFAKAAGAMPVNGTKKTHPEIRERYKTCMLALNYGMSAETFAKRAKISLAEAKLMIKLHKMTYSGYWKWISNFIDIGLLSGSVQTRFHWNYNTTQAEYRTLLNFPMQAHGADILRLGISMCLDNGVRVVAPVHDAILIETSIEEIDLMVAKAQYCMEVASEFVLNYKLRTEAKTIRYPEHYTDPRGDLMWEYAWDILDHMNPEEKAARLRENIMENVSLDEWDTPTVKPDSHLSKRKQQQRRMKPASLSEKSMIQRIQKKSNYPYMKIMHLVNEARDTDFDLEHEIDWEHEDYDTAKRKVQQKRTIKEVHSGEY